MSFIYEARQLFFLKRFVSSERRSMYIMLGIIPAIGTLQAVNPLLIRCIVGNGIAERDLEQLKFFGLMWFIVILLDCFCRIIFVNASGFVVQDIVKNIRISLFRHILSLNSAFHDRVTSGLLVSKTTSDIDFLAESLDQGLVMMVIDIVVLLGAFVGLFMLSYNLGLLVTALFVLLALAIYHLTIVLRKWLKISRYHLGAFNSFVQDSLYGLTTLKLLGGENQFITNFSGLNDRVSRSQNLSVATDALIFAVIDGFATVTMGVAFYFWAATGFGYEIRTNDVGILVAFVKIVDQIYDPLKQIGNKISAFQGVFTAINRLNSIFFNRQYYPNAGTKVPTDFSLAFKSVSFKYSHDFEQHQLDNIQFTLADRNSLAIAGPTGSGKSTIAKLIAKLYDEYLGTIEIGGVCLKQISRPTWNEVFAYVPQDAMMIHGTIYDNVVLGRPGITKSIVSDICRLIGLDGTLGTLAIQDFVILEGGANLSQGQRQLISIARALVCQPRLIVLDEVTAAMDPNSEKLVSAAIEKLFIDRTVIVIAHRLKTIQKCTKILILEDGRVTACGSHAELLSLPKDSFYRRFFANNAG